MSLSSLSLVVDNTRKQVFPTSDRPVLEGKAVDTSPLGQVMAEVFRKLRLTPRPCPIEATALHLDPEEVFDATTPGLRHNLQPECLIVAVRGETTQAHSKPNRLTLEMRVRDKTLQDLPRQERLEITGEISRALPFGSLTWSNPGLSPCGYFSYKLSVPLVPGGSTVQTLIPWLVDVLRSEVLELMRHVAHFAAAYKGRKTAAAPPRI